MVKNKDLCIQVLEAIQTLTEALDHVSSTISDFREQSYRIFLDAAQMLQSLQLPIEQLAKEDADFTADLIYQNTLHSYKRVADLLLAKDRLAKKKLDDELSPLLCELYVEIYFYGLIHPDIGGILQYHADEVEGLCMPPFVAAAEESGTYKYELSIIMPAFNHVEASKACIESLFENIPPSLSYELILYNHGSTDGTEAYFQSVHPHKQLDMLHNIKSFGPACRVIEGKYCMFVSNDVVFTPNAIGNLLQCIQSDDSIGMIAPTTPNISNNQTIPASYRNKEELDAFGVKNNISDPFRWEQRVRLTPPVCVFRSNNLYAYPVLGYAYLHQPRGIPFGDDSASLLLRRNGYRNFLCKDAYIHHIGSLTFNKDMPDNDEKRNVHHKGRILFHQVFGVDPWGKGFCYSKALFDRLTPSNASETIALGLDNGMGENILHVRECIKQNARHCNVKLHCITTEPEYLEDLKAVCDEVKIVPSLSLENLASFHTKYHYIIVESDFRKLDKASAYIQALFSLLQPGAWLAFCSFSSYTGVDQRSAVQELFTNLEIIELTDSQTEQWCLVQRKE